MSCKEIKIRKGQHYTRNIRKFGIGRNFSIRRLVIFKPSCRYTLHYPDYLDINKLFGFTEGFNPHKNSIRVGWRYNKQQDCIDLFHYQYKNGKRDKEFLCSVDLDTPIEISIEAKGHIYLTKVERRGLYVEKLSGRSKRSWIHFYLYVYFGGNMTAPNDMEIHICKL